MHYVRFLRTPRAQLSRAAGGLKKGAAEPLLVAAVVTIATDLGDSTLGHDVDVHVSVSDAARDGAGDVARTIVPWTAYAHALPLSIAINASVLRGLGRLVMRVSCGDADAADALLTSSENDGGLVLPALWGVESEPFAVSIEGETTQAGRTMLRRIGGAAIWEEAGESIARHVWDAGVGLAALLHHWRGRAGACDAEHWAASLDVLGEVLGPFCAGSTRGPSIVELGCGTGVVGLSVAGCIDGCRVDMTDLAEHGEFVEANIAAARPVLDARRSQAHFTALDWTHEVLPVERLAARHDVIIAGDVMYNVDFSVALAKTISRLESRSSGAAVLLATKSRHGSEAAFLDTLTGSERFGITRRVRLWAPTGATLGDLDGAEEIEILLLRRAGMSKVVK